MNGRRIIDNSFEQENAAILSTFFPIGSTSPTTATATITTSTTTNNTMEPSELTKRLLMNRPPPKPLQNDQAVSSISAGQASAVAAAQQQRHDHHPHQHKYHNEEGQAVEHHDDRSQASSSAAVAPGAAPHSPHPTSAALIQAAAAAAASSVAAATSSSLNDMVEQEKQSRRRKDFPWKLHCMLEEADTFNNRHIVSWMPDGRSFRVFLPDEFVSRIMPHYFHQTQYRSFQRMLNLYDFAKVVTGPNRGAYSHPMFIRSDRNLCLQMRIRKRNTSKKSKKTTQAAPAENRTAPTRGGGRAEAEPNQAVYPLLTSFQEAQQQQNQNFTAPGVDMEGLYPMFQQPMLQQYDQHQYQQQSHLQPFQFQSLGQLEQQHDESPLTSRQIFTLDPNNFQGRIMNQDPSASTRTASNTPPTHGISPATWKNAILQRSLLSTNPTSDDQRVNLSPPSLGMMDRMVRGRADYGANQDESKSSSSVQYETKVRQKSSHMVQNQPAFQLPLHFDLEPTPLPPHERSNM